jgi:hypothetical protein
LGVIYPEHTFMLHLLDRKIRQLHEALGAMRSPSIESVQIERGLAADNYYFKIDFNQSRTEAELSNLATLLVANIACLKDHLKVWCEANKAPFEGDTLINTNRDAALIHDLWNTDKHAVLNKPRSGHKPKLVDIRQRLALSTGTSESGGAVLQIEMATGKLLTHSLGDGSAGLRVTARIVDENGVMLGELSDVCQRATEAWERTLVQAGISIPART